MRNSYKFFLFFIFFIFSTQIFALEALKIDEKSDKINLTPHSELFIDAQNHFRYEAVSQDSFADNFRPADSQSIANGYTNETIWIRFSVVNESKKHFDGTVEMPVPWIDTMEAFAQKDKEVYALNPYNGARSFFVPFTVQPMQKATIYIKIKSQNAIILAPMLHSKQGATQRLNYTLLFNGILIGIMLIMILYNFINFIALKNRNYLYYGLYLIGLFFLMGTYYGYNRELFFHNSTLAPLTVAFSFLAALLFVNHFFQIKENFPKLGKYVSVFIAATLVFGLLFLIIESNALVYFFAALASLIFLFLFYLSAKAYKEKISGALYLLFA
ncbi:MAG: 7TM diverse intracellular signaling domain-containing protein [Sulfurimonas sp.]|uniref:7TMR-DISM family protein n=1 Tax=Sulfurimonas sp. TaxID=2022749 RepID=UPI0026362C74|nr:7TM diverse intracellular signaling domain-containing protein [Sulfurimonas sp.]MDD2652963.1 7TM diverse intracellular signaling domain-containing protein [Sulfurimonas sp.]MDD3452409.1 7TM diverse intracellular signaling domain-containing protein [Sulfurimonas sp.]